MADQESNVKVKITTEDKTRAGVDSAKGNFSKLKDGLNEVAKATTGMDLTTLTAAGAIVMAVNEAKKAVSEYSNYVETIDKLSMSTGMASEELSRLVQVGDDFRVDIGAMQGALKMALQNGFNPTTEALAQLADEMAGIQDPTQRANRLQEIFGRQWQSIVPLLDRGGAAIREAVGEIGDGLVPTQEAIEANREYQAAVDTLSDSWTEAKYIFAAEVIPTLTFLLERINANTKAAQENAEALEQGYGKIEGLGGGYGNLATQMRDATLAQIGMTDEEKRAREAAQKNADAHNNDLVPAITNTTNATIIANTELRTMETALANSGSNAVAAAGHLDELKTAQENFNGAVQSFNDRYAGDVVSQLEQAGIKGADLDLALQAVDKTMGTNYATEKLLQDELTKIIDNYKKTGDIDNFTTALDGNRSKWAEVDDAIAAAYDEWQKFIGSIGAANGMKIEIIVETIRAFSSGISYNTGNSGLKNNELPSGYKDYMPDAGGATGLSMTVPPGYDEINGRPFIIAANSGEQVEISQPGTKEKNAQVINQYTFNYSGNATSAQVYGAYQMARVMR